MTIRPRRSALYMPGSNARALEKAKSLPADVIIVDLEDSIAPSKKDEARAQAAVAVKAGGYGRRELVFRINGPGTPWFEDDLAAAIDAAPDAVLIPKIETPLDLERIGERLVALGAPERTRIWIMVETPLAVLNATAIAETSARYPDCRLSCFVLGTNDILKDTRALATPDRMPLSFALQATVLAARAYGLDILDGVYNAFRDLDGFRRECVQGRTLGMDGKTVIHPDQIVIANEVFAPPADEVAWARKIIAAFELPENQAKGVVQLDGQMVELLHAEIARRTVTIADAIQQQGG